MLAVRAECSVVTDALPKRVQRDSEASRKSVVPMALLLAASMGTSVKDFFMESKNVAMIAIGREVFKACLEPTLSIDGVRSTTPGTMLKSIRRKGTISPKVQHSF